MMPIVPTITSRAGKLATAANQQAGILNASKRYNKDDRLTANVALDHVDYDPATNTVKPAMHAEGGPKVQVKTSGAKVADSATAAITTETDRAKATAARGSGD